MSIIKNQLDINKLLCDIFYEIINNVGENPTHFKLLRVAKTQLIELIPNDCISDFHLDSYCLYFYSISQKQIRTKWIGDTTLGFNQDELYPLHELLNAKN